MDLESRDSKEGITSLVHFKSDLVWKKLNTFEILSVYMDVESGDSKEGMAEKVQAMRDKAEELTLN